MSYDLTFVHKNDEQSWEEALEAPGQDTGSPDANVWALILADTRAVLGEVGVYESPEWFELHHEPTGIQLSLSAGSAGITVPYWYEGSRATTIIGLIYDLGIIIERHTGLVGYDAQVGLPLTEAARRVELAASTFDHVAESFAQLGIPRPTQEG